MPISNGVSNPVAGLGEANTIRAIGPLGNLPTALGTAALALNATTNTIRVPAGFTLLRAGGHMSDMDTGATLAFSLGDAGNPARVFSGFIGAQTGVSTPSIPLTAAALSASNLPTAGFGYRFPVDTTLFLTCTAAATGAVAGVAHIVLEGVID
jgi:hypothetical protein